MTDLFKAGVSLLGAGVVLKIVKDYSDNITKKKKQMPTKEKKKYYRL